MVYKIEGIKLLINQETNGEGENIRTAKKKLKIPKIVKERIWQRLQTLLEKTIMEFVTFLQVLIEDNPSMWHLKKAGLRCVDSIDKTLNYWKIKEKYLVSDPIITYEFGMFFKDVLNMEKEGTEIIEDALILLRRVDKMKQDLVNIDWREDLSFIKEGCAILRYNQFVRNNFFFPFFFNFNFFSGWKQT